MTNRHRYSTRMHAIAWFGIWLALVVTSYYCRPLLPFAETKIAAYALEMWQNQVYDSLILNGSKIVGEPPLLVWLINGVWSLVGVSEEAMRLLSALMSLGTMLLTALAARLLWPDDTKARCFAPLVLIGTLYWTLFASALISDLLVSFLSVLGINGIILAWRKQRQSGWLVMTVSLLLCLLTTGLVSLAYLVPVASVAFFWRTDHKPLPLKQWYSMLVLAVMTALILYGAWVWQSSTAVTRNVTGYAGSHVLNALNAPQPLWWYLVHLPLVLFPWALWPPLWRGIRAMSLDSGVRFCLWWAGSGLLIFILLGGVDFNALLPLFPALALLVARAPLPERFKPQDSWLIGLCLILAGLFLAIIPWVAKVQELPSWITAVSPLWGLGLCFMGATLCHQYRSARVQTLALMSVAVTLAVNFGIVRAAHAFYNVEGLSQRIAFYQQNQVEIAHVGRYVGQFHFAGRLQQPLPVLDGWVALKQWQRQYPEGRLIIYPTKRDANLLQWAEYVQAYRGGYVAIVPLVHANKIPNWSGNLGKM